jgi:hypothetical protein
MRKAVGGIALALLIAATGCTTNNNPGNGQPTNTPSTTPSSTPGASSGSTSTQGPMASAITTPKTNSERAAATVDAIAVLAADQAYRGRVLGGANPGPQGAAVVSTTVAAPASSKPTVSTADSSLQTSPASSSIRLETDSAGNVIMTNVSAASAPVVSTTTTATTSTTTTTTASTSRMRRFMNYLKGKK